MLNLNCSCSRLTLGLFALSFVTSACTEDIDSKDLRTSGMYPEFTAIADGSGGTQLTARIKAGGNNSNTFANVADDDSLIGTVGDETKKLREVGTRKYGADFNEDEGGTEITIALERGEADDGAPDSTATLPEPFKLTLESEKIIPRGEPIRFSWEPADEPGTMNWKLDSDCTFLASGNGIGDDGEFTIPAKEHRQLGEDDADECQAKLILDRVLNGRVDSAFDGGEFLAIQRRVVTFTSVAPETEEPPEEDAGTDPVPVPDAGDEPVVTPDDAGAGDAGTGDAGE